MVKKGVSGGRQAAGKRSWSWRNVASMPLAFRAGAP